MWSAQQLLTSAANTARKANFPAPSPMGKGCSGGPWVGALSHEFDPHSNMVCGLNSHMYDNDPGAMYGPYFDVETVDLYDYIRTGTSPGRHR